MLRARLPCSWLELGGIPSWGDMICSISPPVWYQIFSTRLERAFETTARQYLSSDRFELELLCLLDSSNYIFCQGGQKRPNRLTVAQWGSKNNLLQYRILRSRLKRASHESHDMPFCVGIVRVLSTCCSA